MKIIEKKFDRNWLEQYASILSIGNGALGMRSTHFEDYDNQTKGMYLAGVYSNSIEDKIEEIVNLPDVVKQDIYVNGIKFNLMNDNVSSYERYLDLEKAELVRKVYVVIDNIALKIIHVMRIHPKEINLIQSTLEIEANQKCDIAVVDQIDGRVTNQGKQLYIDDKVRVVDNTLLANYRTINNRHKIQILMNSSEIGVITYKNKLFSKKVVYKETNSVIHKKSVIVKNNISSFEIAHQEIKEVHNQFRSYQDSHYHIWSAYWGEERIILKSSDDFDQLALDFAVYHMKLMTPKEDQDISIAAKGLSGEGYKGHTFWDAEIFNFPFVLKSNPKKAKELLIYRYNRLHQAQKKAISKGYKGALFPWESALTGEEETPEFAALNVRTGRREVVSSAIAEHHIVADIAYAVNQYYQHTLDEEFMKSYGIELLEETARFWLSRVENVNGRLEILEVIGPDEYTEFIDNNAYTNYLATNNIRLAMEWSNNVQLIEQCKVFMNNIYLPKEDNTGVIPQDDNFLEKKKIDISYYRETAGQQTILLDYSRHEVINMQVLKQADVVMLLWLFRDNFNREVHKANLVYYEPLTIHDSSLSRNVHASLYAYIGEPEISYEHFEKGMRIDLDNGPKASAEGIHAASIGSILNTVFYGFMGIEVNNQIFSIAPCLPRHWESICTSYQMGSIKIMIKVTHNCVVLKSNRPIEVNVFNSKVALSMYEKVIKYEGSSIIR